MSPTGRPSDAPRLSEVDPVRLAESVVAALVDYLHVTALKVDMSAEVRVPHVGALASTSLGYAISTLTRYAQTGCRLDALPEDYLQSVCEALYVRPGDHGHYEVPVLDAGEEADADTEIGVVLLATVARCRLRDGEPLRVRELAALASVATSRLRQLAGAGEIEMAARGEVASDEARRWLAARGVAGVDAGRGRN